MNQCNYCALGARKRMTSRKGMAGALFTLSFNQLILILIRFSGEDDKTAIGIYIPKKKTDSKQSDVDLMIISLSRMISLTMVAN